MLTIEQRIGKLEDDAAIRALVASFADAESRNDQALVRELWENDGVFAIDKPMENRAEGIEKISELLSGIRGSKEFFVQFIHSGLIDINGTSARGRWLVREVAKGQGQYYNNFAFFDDTYEKHGGKWLFRKRSYHYAYLDLTSFTGDAIPLPASLDVPL